MERELILLIGIFVINISFIIITLMSLYVLDKTNWNCGYCHECHTKWKPDELSNFIGRNDYKIYICNCLRRHKIQLYFTKVPLIIGGNNNENKKDKGNTET